MAGEIKVFAINECDWFAAESPEEALRGMAETYDYETTPEGIAEMRKEFSIDDPLTELTADDLERLSFHEEGASGEVERVISFRQHLDELIEGNAVFPCLFASSEC